MDTHDDVDSTGQRQTKRRGQIGRVELGARDRKGRRGTHHRSQVPPRDRAP